jgi:hypothetical protein
MDDFFAHHTVAGCRDLVMDDFAAWQRLRGLFVSLSMPDDPFLIVWLTCAHADSSFVRAIETRACESV